MDAQRATDDRDVLLARVCEEHQLDFEAQQALLGLVLRAVDEVRFGLRALDVEDLRSLAVTWSMLIEGDTPTEARLRFEKKD